LSVGIYTDVHIPYQITIGLRLRGVDVVTAQDDGTAELEDAQLLDRATSLGRILFSQDQDLLREGHTRQVSGQLFAGIVYAPQLGVTFSRCISDLEIIAKCTDPADWIKVVQYLPL